MLTWTYILVLDIKGKHNFKLFYYIHIIEIPTNKGAHSYNSYDPLIYQSEKLTITMDAVTNDLIFYSRHEFHHVGSVVIV